MTESLELPRTESQWEAKYHSACRTARAEAERGSNTTVHLYETQRLLTDTQDALTAEQGKSRAKQRLFLKEIYECETVLARALDFPAYQPGEPGYSPTQTNYITGAHTAVTLAVEAEDKIDELKDELKDHEYSYSRLNSILGGLKVIAEREREAGNVALADELSRLTSREE